MGQSCRKPEKNKKEAIFSVSEVADVKNIEKRRFRDQLPVVFVQKRISVKMGDSQVSYGNVWVAEHIRAIVSEHKITKEYYGTLPFDASKPAPCDRGFYDDYERTIRYNFKNQEMIVNCIFQLTPLSSGGLSLNAYKTIQGTKEIPGSVIPYTSE